MLYLHDIWVNWFEGEENGYNVCSYHEWRKSDSIELLDQVPLIKVEKKTFEFIENDLDVLPTELLSAVHNRAYYRKNHERKRAEYCAVITDGIDILAFDTAGHDIPLRKSRLIPRQEQLVYEMVENEKPYAFKENNIKGQKKYHILSPHPKEMYGLTRSERTFKQIIYMALDQISQSDVNEILYWFLEWNEKTLFVNKEIDKEMLWNQLYSEIKEGWSQRHFNFGKNIIKGKPFFEKLWENQVKEMIINK